VTDPAHPTAPRVRHALALRLTRRTLIAQLLCTGTTGAWAGSAGALAPVASRPDPPRLISLALSTQGDLLEYSTQQLSCPAGSRVRVSFTNAAKYVHFDHNWVLLRPGFYDQVLAAAEQAGEANGYLPPSHPGIIAATAQAHRGETVSTQFDAPPVGRYPYICSTPGHAQSMWGVLTVTNP
jgi:azurin